MAHEVKPKKFSLSMMAFNQTQPFVSREFSGKIARLVIEEKYPRSVFVLADDIEVNERDDAWMVTVKNKLYDKNANNGFHVIDGQLIPKQLTVTIGKYNAEIIDISR